MLIIRLRVNKQEFLENLMISDALALAWSSAFRRLIRSFQPRKRGTPNLEKSSLKNRSDVAPAPFKLLPDYTEERSIWQRR